MAGSMTVAHPQPQRATLVPRLHGRLDVLLGRLDLHSPLPAESAALGQALHEIVDQIGQAELTVGPREWVLALRATQNCEPHLQALLAAARARPDAAALHPDPVRIVQALWVWMITQPALYCRLHILHLGLALLDPDDQDDDDDTDVADYAGHLGEELVRQVAAAEQATLRLWPAERYRLYRQLYTNYQRLRSYSRARGWVEEGDALDYMMRRARMHGLHFYVFEPRQRGADGRLAGGRRPDRLAVFGRLLIDRFYWLTAGFGYRPLRAVFLNIAVVLACALLFWHFDLLCVYTDRARHTVSDCQPVGFYQAGYFSALAFFLAAMGEILPRPPWGQALLVLESIWGFLNMSVVIAVILNRHSGD